MKESIICSWSGVNVVTNNTRLLMVALTILGNIGFAYVRGNLSLTQKVRNVFINENNV